MIPDPTRLRSEIDAVRVEAHCSGVTLFGAGGFAQSVRAALRNAGIPVHAFVVSVPERKTIDDVPVVSLEGLDRELADLPMWLAVFNRNASSDLVTIAATCAAHGVARPRLPQAYFEAIEEWMGWRYWLADRRKYADHRADIELALQALGDEESRRQFSQALRFRTAPNESGMPVPSSDAQYFPDHVVGALRSSGQGLVFVDAGAYDGDTLMQAASRLNLGTAVAFEPDAGNYLRLVRNVDALDFPVVCIPCGLSRTIESLSFVAANGEASAVGDGGNTRIQCVSLDQCLGTQRVDYIKFDVEGHDLAALEGSLGVIERFRPALGIAAYHRWDDLWRIPAFLRRHAPEYTITYRAHEFNTFDGVFYAVCR